ncbi:unnamed protein product [Diabrotica balteata]|uniref:C2H2-type domain-containing protein n=1 Tax=Diabrotica balteata TaxID=107213 RepID=A0A9N9T7Q2_DIABA|nr:unnamed protein product [Diabrotica balteata]
MDLKVKTEHEEVDLPDLVDPQLLSEEYGTVKHEKYTCSECLEDFNCEFLLNIHKMTHDKTQYCFICKRKVHKRFKEHVMDKHFNQCNVCFQNFNYKRSLVRHMEIHTGNLNYIKCDKCDKRFRQRGSLYSHVRSHHEGIKPYACKECDGTFTTSSGLNRHVKNMHNPDNPKPLTNIFQTHFKTETCTYCGKVFNKKTIEAHLRSHDNKKVITFCELCNKPFGSVAVLKNHLAKHVTARCKLCGMFTVKSMEKHLEAHREGKVQQCTLCDRFVNDIDVHNTNVHKNTQFIFCSMCPEKFTSIAEKNAHNLKAHFHKIEVIKCSRCKEHMDNIKLDDHVRKYHPECVYECDYCDQVVYNIATYNAHLETHRKDFKPYMCNKCLRSYKSEAFLKMHTCTALHHCHLCNKAYNLKRTYDIHMIQKHSPHIITASYTENMNVIEVGSKKLYQCKRCFVTMFREKTTRRHICQVGTRLVRKIFHKCNLCGFLGATFDVMRRHSFKYHENENDWATIQIAKRSIRKPPIRRAFVHSCDCGRRFQYESLLSEHRSKCLMEKPLKCNICDSEFFTQRYLIRHKRRIHVPRVVAESSDEKNLSNIKNRWLKRRAAPVATVITYRQRKKALKCKLCNYVCFNSKYMGHHKRTNHDIDNLCLEELNYKPEVEQYVCEDQSQENITPDAT